MPISKRADKHANTFEAYIFIFILFFDTIIYRNYLNESFAFVTGIKIISKNAFFENVHTASNNI